VRADGWVSARLPGGGIRGRSAADPGAPPRGKPNRTRSPRRPRPHPPRWSCPARDSHGQPLRRRAVRHVAVSAGRPAQVGLTGAGPYAADPNDSRAPLMARVSFEDAKRGGIALGWVGAFGRVRAPDP